MRNYILTIIVTAMSIAVQAQTNWTLAVGQENVFYYGDQNTYLGGVRLGFDFRYDFRNGRGIGIETGFYLNGYGRRYNNRDIMGRWSDDVTETINDASPGISQGTLYSDYRSIGMQVPLHLTYTYLFYRDWSITPFVGLCFDFQFMQYASRTDWVLYPDGSTGNISRQENGPGTIEFPLEFGLGFSYRHLQVRAGASVSIAGFNTDGFSYDGTPFDKIEWDKYQYGDPNYRVAKLYFTVGYRF